ncbi:15886_t:CDS:1, partial [Dentiscutata heterogama]
EDEVLRLLISKLSHIDHLSCQYIKKDSSICRKGCWHELGCAIHYKTRSKKLYLICNKLTNSYTGICSSHGEIYKKAWREGKKVKIESDMIETPS